MKSEIDYELDKKYNNLKKIVKGMGSLIVAFSGGIDSTLILKIAHDVLGDNAIAVTADSPSVSREDIISAKKICRESGINHYMIRTKEIENEDYIKNPNNRCYYCKSELYAMLRGISKKLGINNIANGTNYDDLKDYRPGLKAAKENNILSPLSEQKVTKAEVRALAKRLGLKIWNKPSSPCLSSRIPYNTIITVKKLSMVEQAEKFIKEFGIIELRVRHYGDTAKIEVDKKEFHIIENNIGLIENNFRDIGFKNVILDDKGFRSGALNEVLNVRR